MVKFKKIMSIFLIGTLAMNLVACGSPSTTTETTEVATTKNEDINTDDLDADTSLSVEEKYEKAVARINMDEYLTPSYDNMIPITPEQALEKVENGETFVVFNGRSDCRYCKYVYPMCSEELPEDMKIYYVSTDYFRYLYPTVEGDVDDENTPKSDYYNYVADKHNNYKKVMDFEGVPNIRYFKNGKRILNISNPLSPDFFEDTTSSETKEQLLSTARETLRSYLIWIHDDMDKVDETQEPSVTVVK